MAEEESQEETQQELPSKGQPPAPSGGSKLIPIVIVVLLLLLIVGGVAVYFLVFSNDSQEVEATSAEEAKFVEQFMSRSQPSVESLKKGGVPVFSPVFVYTVNMKDNRHKMRLAVKAMLYDEMAMRHLMKSKPVIDNNMMKLLREWSAEDLRNRSGIELLKRAIYKEMNSHFEQSFIEMSESKDRTPVKDVLIVEYYID
ncbi:flagellar basal body-associated FliL family protein [bacterium]|nr:flagellar basal body-associated FliL family protein [bacterium]